MEIPKMTQFELTLMFQLLKIAKRKPKHVFIRMIGKFMTFLDDSPETTLSALWQKFNSTLPMSRVCIPPEEYCGAHVELQANVSELDCLRGSPHAEVKHDPLLFIRTFYDMSLGELLSASPTDRTILVTALLMMSLKSARSSLILHSMLVVHLFKDDMDIIKNPYVYNFISKVINEKKSEEETAVAYLTALDAAGAETESNKNEEPTNVSDNNVLLISFGKADHGKLGLGDAQVNRPLPTIVDTLKDVELVKVVSMSTSSFAISNEGAVYIWGTGSAMNSTSSSRADYRPQLLDTISSRFKVVDISCGLGHCLLLEENGKVYSFGTGGNGRLGHGENSDRGDAVLIVTLSDEIVVQVQCGASHSLALTRQGQVYSWGKSSQGQCGHGLLDDCPKPALIKKLVDIPMMQLVAGWEHSIALTVDGRLYSWGSGYKDSRRGIIPPVLGLGHSECRPSPELITSLEGVHIMSISSGWDHCLALDDKHKLLSWGSGQNGKLGQGSEENVSLPCYISALEKMVVVSFSAGCEHSACITDKGELFTWGHGDSGRLGLGLVTPCSNPQKVVAMEDMGLKSTFIHCGDKFSLVLAQRVQESRVVRKAAFSTWEIVRYFSGMSSSLNEFPLQRELQSIAAQLTNENLATESLSNRSLALGLAFSLASMAFKSLVEDSVQQLDATAPSSTLHDDSPFVVELCEDTLYNASALLEILSGPYTAYLHAIINDDIWNEKGHEAYEQNIQYNGKLLYHIIVLLTANLNVISNIINDQRLQMKRSESDDDDGVDITFALRRDNSPRPVQSRPNSKSNQKYDKQSVGPSVAISTAMRSDESSEEGLHSRYQHEREELDESELDASQDDFGEGEEYSAYSLQGKSPVPDLFTSIDDNRGRQEAKVSNATGAGALPRGMNLPSSLSPAPSYESLENSVNGKEEAEYSVEGESMPGPAIFSNEDIDEEEPAEDIDEEENVQLQQALLLSIGPRRVAGIDSRLLGPVIGRRGSSYIPGIRNSINSLASMSFMVLQHLQELMANMEDPSVADSKDGLEEVAQNAYRIWESCQLCTAYGLDGLYDESERKSVTLQIVHSPSSFLYIIPGIVCGLEHRLTLESSFDDMFPDTGAASLFFEDNPQSNMEGVTLSLEDIIRVVEQLLQLYQTDAELKNIDREWSMIANICFQVNTKIRSAFARMSLSLVKVPVFAALQIALTEGFDDEERYTLLEDRLSALFDMILDCCILELEDVCSNDNDWQLSPILLDVFELLFEAPVVETPQHHLVITRMLLPFVGNLLQQLRKIIEYFAGGESAVPNATKGDALYAKVFAIVQPFLVQAIVILTSSPPQLDVLLSFDSSLKIVSCIEKSSTELVEYFTGNYSEIKAWIDMGERVRFLGDVEAPASPKSPVNIPSTEHIGAFIAHIEEFLIKSNDYVWKDIGMSTVIEEIKAAKGCYTVFLWLLQSCKIDYLQDGMQLLPRALQLVVMTAVMKAIDKTGQLISFVSSQQNDLQISWSSLPVTIWEEIITISVQPTLQCNTISILLQPLTDMIQNVVGEARLSFLTPPAKLQCFDYQYVELNLIYELMMLSGEEDGILRYSLSKKTLRNRDFGLHLILWLEDLSKKDTSLMKDIIAHLSILHGNKNGFDCESGGELLANKFLQPMIDSIRSSSKTPTKKLVQDVEMHLKHVSVIESCGVVVSLNAKFAEYLIMLIRRLIEKALTAAHTSSPALLPLVNLIGRLVCSKGWMAIMLRGDGVLSLFVSFIDELQTRFYGQWKAFTTHLWSCHLTNCRLLLPKTMLLERQSSIIAAGVVAPQGEFALSFWIRPPQPKESSQMKRLHVLSRVPETGEINMYDLFQQDPRAIDSYTLAVYLIRSDADSMAWKLEVNTITYSFDKSGSKAQQQAAPTRKRKLHRQLIESELLLSQWNRVHLHVDQTEVATASATALGATADDAARTHVTLSINNVTISTKECYGGNWPLHQNIIIGKLPASAGLSSTSGEGNDENTNELAIADVLWTPMKKGLISSEVFAAHEQLVKISICPSFMFNDMQSVSTLFASILTAFYHSGPELLSSLAEVLSLQAIQMLSTGTGAVQDGCIKLLTMLNVSGRDYLVTLKELLMTLTDESVTLTTHTALDNESFTNEWLKRLYISRIGVCKQLFAPNWNALYITDESALFQQICMLFSAQLGDDSLALLPHEKDLLHLGLNGGQHTAVCSDNYIDIWPRRSLFPTSDKLAMAEEIAFPCAYPVSAEGAKCAGLAKVESAIIPYGYVHHNAIEVPHKLTQMVSYHDLLPMNSSEHKQVRYQPSVISSLTETQAALKAILDSAQAVNNAVNGHQATTTGAQQHHHRSQQWPKSSSSKHESLLLASLSTAEISDSNSSKSKNALLPLLQQAMKLRYLCVESTKVLTNNSTDIEQFLAMTQPCLSSIMQFASLDALDFIISQFGPSSFTEEQWNVLHNLIREGDIFFLEKLTNQVWKLFHIEQFHRLSQTLVAQEENALQLQSIGGEMVITGTKVRAIGHFPSVQLKGVALERMTGRWFYEVTLLSDGLMQIGWANDSFRCDAVHGQGVGDHLHSWAYDGLRTKKWNLSCEVYGKRWHTGDVVGVLVDMDLLEMRYYLNGEDLGPAFEDFPDRNLFPAMSLNVRQTVRINFGQYKFTYPPDKIDRKVFRGVLYALEGFHKPSATSASTFGQSSPSKKHDGAASDSTKSISANEAKNDKQANDSSNSPTRLAVVATATAAASTPSGSAAPEASNADGAIAPTQTPAAFAVTDRASPSFAPSSSADTSAIRAERDPDTFSAANFIRDMEYIENLNAEHEARERAARRARASGERYHSDDEDDEHDDGNESDDQQYVLVNSRWQEDMDARIRMEAEEGDDYDVDDDQDNDDDGDSNGDDRDGDDNENDDEEDDGNEESRQVNDLRRQAMMESLIGMGFPLEWVLRAAERRDISTSESSAIAWIIESMDNEQNKLNSEEGDSSRYGGDGNDGGNEFDEDTANDMEYLLQRHAAAAAAAASGSSSSSILQPTRSTSARGLNRGGRGNENRNAMINRRMVAEHMAELLDGTSNSELLALGVTGTGLSPGSPAREDSYATRRGQMALGLILDHQDAYDAYLTSKLLSNKKALKDAAKDGTAGTKDSIDGYDLAYGEAIPWNDEVAFPPLLPGTYYRKRGQDQEKQEVLLQIAEMYAFDMLPIIATCEFVLCIYYARAVLTRLIQLTATRTQNTPSSQISFLIEATEPVICLKYLRNTFRQHAIATQFPDRLFPPFLFGNDHEEATDKFPAFSPFLSSTQCHLTSNLVVLEWHKYPQSMGTVSVEEHSSVVIDQLQYVLRTCMRFACAHIKRESSPASAISAQDNIQDEQETSVISSSLSALQDRLIRRVTSTEHTTDTSEDSHFARTCEKLITIIIQSALDDLDRAVNAKFDGQDWIGGNGLDSFTEKASSKDAALPSILFSYWSLKTILSEFAEVFFTTVFTPGQQQDEAQYQRILTAEARLLLGEVPYSDGFYPKSSFLSALISPDGFARLLKVSSAQNDSLRFCIYDLSGTVLGLLNRHLQRAQAWQDHHMKADYDDFALSSTALSNAQTIASEFYLSVIKEKRLMQSFSSRLKMETVDKSLHTRYTRSLGDFLLQWQLLRKTLGLATFTYMQESKRLNLLPAFPQLKKIEKELRVTQVSASSITVSWKLTDITGELSALDATAESIAALSTLDGYHLYVTTLTQMGSETPLIALSNLDYKGVYRADDLEPDTLYKICIRKEPPHEIASGTQLDTGDLPEVLDNLSVVLPTDGEATFGFQPDSVSPNIVIGSPNGLTLKNISNKKWSTARANVRLTAGIHRWDVHIDKCVSKNIFVGVATREARLDNYVGCDAYGWAFLANKAVWNNKGKVKTYGDLFRTGDTVGVILDLDAGTLSFTINDRNMGIAVDGLVGPLYPAFSLYNEEDQVTVAQVRSIQESSGSSLGSFSSDQTLDRLETLRTIMSYLQEGHALSTDIIEEITQRFLLWQEDTAVRTVIAPGGGLVTIMLSDLAVRAFSLQRFTLGTVVMIEKRKAEVIGVGGAKLWLRILGALLNEADASAQSRIDNNSSGELLALTFDTMYQLLDKGLLAIIGSNKHNNSKPFGPVDICNLPPVMQSNGKDQNREKWSADQLKEFLSSPCITTNVGEDVKLLSAIAEGEGISVFSLSLFHISRAISINDMSNDDVLIRAGLILLVNDLLQAMFPLLIPLDGTEQGSKFESGVTHPTALLLSLRPYVFAEVKECFTLTVVRHAAKVAHEGNTAVLSILHKLQEQDRLQQSPPLALLVSNDKAVAQSMKLSLPQSKNEVNKTSSASTLASKSLPVSLPDMLAIQHQQQFLVVGELGNISTSQLQLTVTPPAIICRLSRQHHNQSKAWYLAGNLQCTLVHQVLRWMNCIGSTYASAFKPTAPESVLRLASQFAHQRGGSHDLSQWEGLLRACDALSSSVFSFRPRAMGRDTNLTLPITFSSFQISSNLSASATGKGQEDNVMVQRFLRVLEMKEALSEWTIMAMFVEAACYEAQQLISELFSKPIEFDQNSLDAAQTALLLQHFHAIGLLLGLALRSSVYAPLKLPASFLEILAGDFSSSKAEKQSNEFAASCALVLRQGICSMYPQTAWSLWTCGEISAWLTLQPARWAMASGMVTAQILYRHHRLGNNAATNSSTEQAQHTLFWAALYDLTAVQLQKFCKKVFDTAFTEAAYNEEKAMPILTILPPIAEIMLMGEAAGIAVIPSLYAVSLPKFTKIVVVKAALEALLAE